MSVRVTCRREDGSGPISRDKLDAPRNAGKILHPPLKCLCPPPPPTFLIASLKHKSFFRVSDSTHSQAVNSATYMQFKAVITSVRLSPKEHAVTGFVCDRFFSNCDFVFFKS